MEDIHYIWESLPHVDHARIVKDLKRLGLRSGMTVLVHSSLSRIGNVEGGAETVVRALLDAVAPNGTVLFPTLTGSEQDRPEHPPHVDLRTTSCWTGRIPQAALQIPWSQRSLHPTHSVTAIGEHAVLYATGHELSRTPCDENSPYYRLLKEQGMILLIGVNQQSNTTLHCIEELQAVPYHLQPQVTAGTVIDENGVELIVPNRLHLWGWERDFTKIDQRLLDANAMVIGTIGSTTSRLMQAAEMADEVISAVRADELYLLSDIARIEWIEQQAASGR